MRYCELTVPEFQKLLAKSDIDEDRFGVTEEFERVRKRKPDSDQELEFFLIRKHYDVSRKKLLEIVAAHENDEVMPELLGEHSPENEAIEETL